MGRLIDADRLLNDVRKHSASYFADDFAHEWVDQQPTVDAVPVRHGRWEWDGEAFICTCCHNGYKGQPTIMGEPMFEFCPVCGARMDEKDGDRHDSN